MDNRNINLRTGILAAIFIVTVVLFLMRGMQMQIVDGDMYDALVNRGVQKIQTIEAARGEILDRNGRPLATNRVSYDIVLEKAFLPTGSENSVILKLTDILREQETEWIDNLPISSDEPFEFLPGAESSVAALKKFVDVNEYASAESVMHWLVQKYGLEDYPASQARLLAGVRYEMSIKDFGYSLPYVFAKDVSVKTGTIIKERGYLVPGADVLLSAKRVYPDGTVAPHIIGELGPIYAEDIPTLGEGYRLSDYIGKSGIEKKYESSLKGNTGEKVVYINSEGDVTEVIETVTPVPGDNVYLTIDRDLQKVASEALANQIEWMKVFSPVGRGKEAYAGSVVAIEVKTGEVLALANYPSYDLSTYRQDYTELAADLKARPLLNRALHGSYTPGSIFKPVVAYAGKVSGVIDRDSTVYCGHVYTRFSDYRPTCLGTHANINVVVALRESCNIFFYDVGYRTGLENINKYARLFGLGVDPELELASAVGSLTVKEDIEARGDIFQPGDVLQASIGQKENKFTPLQLANYAATIANRGERKQLSLVKEISSFSGEEIKLSHVPTTASRMPEDPAMFDDVFEGMAACARIGSGSYYSGYLGKTFANYPINVAAKTGTPETAVHLNSTFIIYGPVEDPEIAIAVIIEDGWHGYTGAPVAMAVMDAYFGFVPVPDYDAQTPVDTDNPSVGSPADEQTRDSSGIPGAPDDRSEPA